MLAKVKRASFRVAIVLDPFCSQTSACFFFCTNWVVAYSTRLSSWGRAERISGTVCIMKLSSFSSTVARRRKREDQDYLKDHQTSKKTTTTILTRGSAKHQILERNFDDRVTVITSTTIKCLRNPTREKKECSPTQRVFPYQQLFDYLGTDIWENVLLLFVFRVYSCNCKSEVSNLHEYEIDFLFNVYDDFDVDNSARLLLLLTPPFQLPPPFLPSKLRF